VGNHTTIALLREFTTSVTGTLAEYLEDISLYAGDINAYCKVNGISQEQAARLQTTDLNLATIVRKFAEASAECNDAIEARATKN
jgi:hypothetical protein